MRQHTKQSINSCMFTAKGLFTFKGLTCSTKCWRYWTKISVVIHPVCCATPLHPDGHPFINSDLILNRGKIKNGGTYTPPALMPQTNVMFLPLSADTIFATRFAPLGDNTLGNFVGTVERPDSSTLNI